MELSENVRLNWLNSKQNTISTFLDLKKGFDTVDHQILLAKCSSYGLRGHVLKVLKSYLSRRLQYTEIGSKKSSMRSVKIGVPQGSIMGLLLYITYINDLILETSDIKSILYADDTVVYTESEPKTNETKINVIHQKTASWLKRNRLTLNVEKTKCVGFSKRVQKNSEKVYINSKTIQNVSTFKYLGIQVDHKLSFQEHAKNSTERMLGFCSLLYQIRKVLTTNQLVQVYRLYVQPVIQYGVLVYANTSNQVLKPLNQMVKRIARIITFKKKFDSITSKRKELLLYNVSELHLYEILKMAIKIIRKECEIPVLKNCISREELLKIANARNSSRKLCLFKDKFENFSLQQKIRKMVNCLLNFFPNFVNFIFDLSKRQVKDFVTSFWTYILLTMMSCYLGLKCETKPISKLQASNNFF